MASTTIKTIASILIIAATFALVLGILQQSAIGTPSTQNTRIQLGIPYGYYDQISPPDSKRTPYDTIIFRDYTFRITSYDDKFETLSCKQPPDTNCQQTSQDQGCPIYQCQRTTQQAICTGTSSGLANCPLCQSIGAPTGSSGSCKLSFWNFCRCSYQQITQTYQSGGIATDKFDGAGITWQLTHNGQTIAQENQLPSNQIYVNGCSNLHLRNGIISCNNAIAWDYNIYVNERGRDRDNNHHLGIAFDIQINNRINATLDLNNSYIEGDTAQIQATICNNLPRPLKGIFVITYDFDTFLGLLSKTHEQNISIPSGCTSQSIPFSSNKATDKILLRPMLKIYENGYSGGLIRPQLVLGKENINFDRVLLTSTDYIKLGDVSFQTQEITILPRFTPEDLQQLETKISNLTAIIQDQNKTLDDKITAIQDLELSDTEKSTLIQQLQITDQDKTAIINALEKRQKVFIYAITTLILSLILISYLLWIKR